MTLPIESVLPALAKAFPAARVVIEAPPGAGKSTQLPLFLLQQGIADDGLIVMLQPRRVAALNIAHYLAKQLGEPVGQQVGYTVRGDSKRSKATKLLIITEGVLVRWLQDDPELNGIGTLIFDEFHERNLHSDLSLALVIDALPLRPDLNLLVMSATLPAENLKLWLENYCDNVQVLRSEGRSYPVEYHYRPPSHVTQWLAELPKVVAEAFAAAEKGVLVFLPGVYEIQKVATELSKQLNADTPIFSLHGRIPLQKQREVLNATDEKRIILATNIAETSLTLDGIDVVVDSGRERRSQYLPQYGLSKLSTYRIAKASATQRAGRAGRQQAGQCFRLWARSDEHGFAEYAPPDVATQDLSALVLDVLRWGSQVNELAWFTQPEPGHCAAAEDFLTQAGLLAQRQLTAKARQLESGGSEPRILLVADAAKALGKEQQAAMARVLATLEEPQSAIKEIDLAERSQRHFQQRQQSALWQQRWRHWLNYFELKESSQTNNDGLITALLQGYPDRVAKYDADRGDFQLACGGRVSGDNSRLKQLPWAIIFDVTFHEQNNLSRSRCLLPVDDILAPLKKAGIPLQKKQTTEWIGEQLQLRQVARTELGAIVLSQTVESGPINDEQRFDAFCRWLRSNGLEKLNWSRRAQQLQARVYWLQQANELSVYDLTDEGLLDSLERWAAPYWTTIRSLKQLQQWDPYEALCYFLDYSDLQRVNKACPEWWETPTERKVFINYLDANPRVEVKLQEMFGVSESPRIIDNRQIVTLDLLSPAGRLLQRTNDLGSFWQNAYADVRKEMRGRYPKHPWPEDPLNATATFKTKRHQ
ncbi:ATP-dependent helicase HrpB [Idiomarina sp. HP20-50]|uniref:ATP-dependent helicase HrpB n=1 Tax=Idiomarina sp. HP20-50 TaxID=3070813 RepID=UPI00294B7BF0|nr:ATP-dependent helicase HrpB [Idiomarina sp. HP20-50]MDV6315565.1 ATP-dependent helicase HrpB [Idiomarina sp. HP20-50]